MSRRIVIADAHEASRAGMETMLQPLGAELQVLPSYQLPDPAWADGNAPDVVIVSVIGAIGDQEQRFINQLLTQELKVIVIAGALDWQQARALFLSGVYDVFTRETPAQELLQSVSAGLGAT